MDKQDEILCKAIREMFKGLSKPCVDCGIDVVGYICTPCHEKRIGVKKV